MIFTCVLWFVCGAIVGIIALANFIRWCIKPGNDLFWSTFCQNLTEDEERLVLSYFPSFVRIHREQEKTLAQIQEYLNQAGESDKKFQQSIAKALETARSMGLMS